MQRYTPSTRYGYNEIVGQEVIMKTILRSYSEYSKFPKDITYNINLSVEYVPHMICHRITFHISGNMLYSEYVDAKSMFNYYNPQLFRILDEGIRNQLRDDEYYIQHHPELLV